MLWIYHSLWKLNEKNTLSMFSFTEAGKKFLSIDKVMSEYMLYISEILNLLNLLICNFFLSHRNLCYRDFWHRKRFFTSLGKVKVTNWFFFFATWLHLSFECLTMLNVFINFVPLNLCSHVPYCSDLRWLIKTKMHMAFYPCSNSECKICLLHYWTLLC